MGIYSFHPRKVITCGEGGCLVTDSAQFARTAQMLRNHGEFNKRFIGCGYNFRMSDIQAGVLLPQFRKLEGIIRERQRLAANYDQLLRRLKDTGLVTTAQAPAGYRNSHQAYVIMLDRRIKRDRVKSLLRRKGIESQFGTYCIPQTPFFKKAFYSKPSDYPNALFAYKHSLALPLCHGLNFQGQEFIVEAIERAIETVYRIRERMQ
jgi:dTDP-4-amino-4,6-dideoxygalactose transaminase